MAEDEPKVELEDLEVTDEDAEEVGGGAYQPYIKLTGTKQGELKGTSPP